MAKKRNLPAVEVPDFYGTSSVLINPVRAGLNVDLTINQRFLGRGAPVTSFDNPVIDDFQCDVFWALYLWKLNLLKTPPEGREANRALFEWLMNDPQFQQTRGTYINHPTPAAAAAYEMTKQILENMPDVADGMSGMGQAEQMDDQADDLDQQADQQEQQGNQPQQNQQPQDGDDESDEEGEGDSDWDDEGFDNPYPDEDEQEGGGGQGDDDEDEGNEDEQEQQQGGGGSGRSQSSPDQKRQQAQDLREQAQQLREQSQQLLEQGLQDQFNSMMRASAAKQGNEFGQEVEDFLSDWGFEEGSGIELSIDEIRRLMTLLGDQNIVKLTSFVGRVRDTAMSVLRGRSQAQVLIDSVGYTQDVFDMFIDQQALLSTAMPKEAREYYIRKFFEQGGMIGYTRVSQAKSEGTFIAAIDESGSMQGYVHDADTTRSIIAKALALGLAQAAKQNGQQFYMFGFSSDADEITDLLNERSLPSEMLEWAVNNFNGGTDFDVAMSTNLDIFDNLEEQEKFSADILMITDGQASVDDRTWYRFAQAREQYGVRLHVLLIGNISMHSLEGVADTVMKFDSLESAAETFSAAFWLQ